MGSDVQIAYDYQTWEGYDHERKGTKKFAGFAQDEDLTGFYSIIHLNLIARKDETQFLS